MAAIVALGALSCGPSFQAVYEGDVRFEHCYALDQGPASPEARKVCWRDWLHGYTYGQSRDRVEYAAARFSQLSLAPTLPNEESRDSRPLRQPSPVAAPLPTNAFAPPPNLASSASATAPAASTRAPAREAALRLPGAECSDACAQRWTTCRAACSEHACDECDRGYRTCVPACLHDESSSSRQPPRSLR
jgi:hypothetical protein